MILIKLYLMIYLQVVIHEVGHVIAAKALGADVIKVSVGWRRISVGIGRLKVSPMPAGGYVEVDRESLEKTGKSGAAIFYESGPLATLAFAAGFDIASGSALSSLGLVVAILSFLYNNIFWIRGTDGNGLYKRITDW